MVLPIVLPIVLPLELPIELPIYTYTNIYDTSYPINISKMCIVLDMHQRTAAGATDRH